MHVTLLVVIIITIVPIEEWSWFQLNDASMNTAIVTACFI